MVKLDKSLEEELKSNQGYITFSRKRLKLVLEEILTRGYFYGFISGMFTAFIIVSLVVYFE